MIPRVAKAGRSFKGAALYYLHDKQAMSADRVAFVQTANLPTNNADIAVAHMVDTATHATQLKQAAGITGGRPLQKPVYCYSLAWHTSETPTQAEQLDAAKETLKRLGLADHQAVIIGHNDTDHTHVHVMVNRVCPTTGKAATMSNDRLKLSDWAHEYREQRGELHFCPERDKNKKRRDGGEFVKDDSMTRQEWVTWKKAQTKELWDEYRNDKAAALPSRKAQYDALWQQKENRFALRRDEIKHLYKPIWRDVFKRQAKELADFDAGLTRRIGFALGQTAKSKVLGVVQAIIAKGDLRGDFLEQQAFERGEIAQGQKQRIADASREVTKAYKYDRNTLRDMHRQQDETAREATKTKVDEIWQEKRPLEKSGRDFDQTADRRKDKDNRQEVEREIRDQNSAEDLAAGDEQTTDKEIRAIRERSRNRQRKRKERSRGKGGGRKLGR
ncbi:relaxase/mobilization nuclease domain-containing protein [uncultured Roseobacter sp.]|uniref:relaxase/mobilization nuclease domain-containing protein n=1 Tax=uncultured Roseobacter sp. TaxID=114847 RepID=UPI002634E4E1|nr:relaxase/mobilization nuclease domain-containing protein [uncultured Roseobacter sp.]